MMQQVQSWYSYNRLHNYNSFSQMTSQHTKEIYSVRSSLNQFSTKSTVKNCRTISPCFLNPRYNPPSLPLSPALNSRSLTHLQLISLCNHLLEVGLDQISEDSENGSVWTDNLLVQTIIQILHYLSLSVNK